MFETTKTYSEDQYISKRELQEKENLSGVVLESVWQQIQEYRRIFRFYLFPQESIYLTLNPYVLWRIEKTATLVLRNQQLDHGQLKHCTITLAQRQYIQKYEETELEDLFVYFGIPLHKKLKKAASNFMLSWTIRLFLLLRDHQDICIKASEIILLKEGISILADTDLLQEMRSKLLIEKDKTQDATYAFLSFLDDLQLHISNRMKSLKQNRHSSIAFDEATLREICPAMSKIQALFYARHHEMHHYYTIAQCMDACSVCYETARTAMDGLVTLGWYAKTKVGRKFVYYTNC